MGRNNPADSLWSMLGGVHKPPSIPCVPALCSHTVSQAPDGGLLCTCSEKKVQWYLERELAELVSEEPLSARLKFEPRGRDNEEYYLVGYGVLV